VSIKAIAANNMGKKVWGYQNFSKKAAKPTKGTPFWCMFSSKKKKISGLAVKTYSDQSTT
jgi:hypothetical protein